LPAGKFVLRNNTKSAAMDEPGPARTRSGFGLQPAASMPAGCGTAGPASIAAYSNRQLR